MRLGDYRAAVADAEEALHLGPPRARLFYHAARIYAQAAAAASADVNRAGRDVVIQVGHYQDRAVALVSAALQQLPAGQRAEFWRQQIQADPTLQSISRRLKFTAIAEGATK